MKYKNWLFDKQLKLNEVLNIYLFDYAFTKFVTHFMLHGEKRNALKRILKMLIYVKGLTFIAPSFLIKTAVHRCVPLIFVRRIPKYDKVVYQPIVYQPLDQIKKSIISIFGLVGSNNNMENLGMLLLNCCFGYGPIFRAIREQNKDIANPLIKWKRSLNVTIKKVPKNRRKKRKVYYIYNKYSISYWIRRNNKVRYS